VRQVDAAWAAESNSWLFDLLFGPSSPGPSALVTWAESGQLPAGFSVAERFAVLPAGGGRTFMVSLAHRRGSVSALTSYNALRSTRRRVARRAIGLAIATRTERPLLRGMIDIGTSTGATAADMADALLGNHLSGLLGGRPVVVAFGGGSGPYKKPVLQVFGTDGTPLGYVKVGWNGWTRDAVRREAAALRACAEHKGRLGVPVLREHGTWRDLELIVTAPMPARVRRPARSGLPDASLIREIGGISAPAAGPMAASSWWAELRGRIQAGVASAAVRTLLDGVADRMESADGHVALEFGRWHGDLVPWNLARAGSRLYAWDWESSTPYAPLGFDALHFHFQVAFVAQRRPVAEAAAIALREASPVLADLDVPAAARRLLSAAHLLELAVRHEEARSSSGTADDRFYPAVLAVMDQQRESAAGAAGLRTAGRTAA
jgi:hypothetical protein